MQQHDRRPGSPDPETDADTASECRRPELEPLKHELGSGITGSWATPQRACGVGGFSCRGKRRAERVVRSAEVLLMVSRLLLKREKWANPRHEVSLNGGLYDLISTCCWLSTLVS